MLMGFENPLHTRDPYLGFSQTSKLFSLDQEQGVPVFRTVSTKHRYFNPQAFVAKKPTGRKRVFCLGGLLPLVVRLTIALLMSIGSVRHSPVWMHRLIGK